MDKWGWFKIGAGIGLFIGLFAVSGVFTSIEKPVIYFYPESATPVSVSLQTDELITQSEPFVGWLSPVSWSFTALPNSTLLFDDGKSSYPYLFYETSYLNGKLPLRAGWSTSADELEALLDRELPRLGLNAREAAEFKEYWFNHLPVSPYYAVYVINSSDVDSKLVLSVSPKPDSVVRVILGFKPTDGPEQVPTPVVLTPSRTGFAVVEWGGFVAG